jgi:single-strand DNA-binding protein
MSVNKVILVGNVGKDPEVRHLEGGVTMARFSLATNETYVDKSGQRITQTEWHTVVVWRGLADTVAKYVKSGKLLYIEGKLRTNTYEDKETGVKKYFTEVYCTNFRFLGPAQGESTVKEDHSGASNAASVSTEQDPPMPEPEDDLPF